jgi:hypothetical protein
MKEFINFLSKHGYFSLYIISFFMIAQLIFVIRYSVDVPFLDQFEQVDLLKNPTWQNIFNQHNEHIYIFPKIFFLILAKITHWNIRVETFFNWLFLQCSAFLLWGILKKNVQKENAWMAAILMCFFLTPQYFDNLLCGFQNCFQINLLAAISAVYILSMIKESWLRLHLAVIAGIITTFSGANGVFLWVSLFPLVFIGNSSIGHMVYRRSRVLRIIYWIIVTVIVMKIYFWRYNAQMPYFPPLAYPGVYPKQFILYFFTCLGASFFPNTGCFDKFVYVHTVFGAILCLIFILGLIFGLFNVRKNIAKVCLIIFILLTVAAISLGRGNLNLANALSTRYRLYSILLPILMSGMLISGPGIKTRFGKPLLILLIAGMLIGIFTGWREGIREGRDWYARQQFNRKIMYSYQTATNSELERLHCCPDQTRETISVLKELKYSVFR